MPEWAEAGDLASILQQRRARNQLFSTPEVLSYFQQLCEAVEDKHSRRIMHCEISPSSFVVKDDGKFELLNRGLSPDFGSRTDAAQAEVDRSYCMSPECLRGRAISFPADIWGLGCLLYELITLRKPFDKEGLIVYIFRQEEYDPLPPSCPEFLSRLVRCMLQQDPSHRPDIGIVLSCLRVNCQQ